MGRFAARAMSPILQTSSLRPRREKGGDTKEALVVGQGTGGPLNILREAERGEGKKKKEEKNKEISAVGSKTNDVIYLLFAPIDRERKGDA